MASTSLVIFESKRALSCESSISKLEGPDDFLDEASDFFSYLWTSFLVLLLMRTGREARP